MGWLRLDDGFAMHPKIAALSDRDYRAWTKVLLYCARYRTQGDVPDHAFREIGINAQSRRKFIAVGLLDLDADGITSIHDWADFNPPDPTNAERQKRWRERQKEAKRNAGRNTRSNAGDRYDSVTEPLREASRAPARDPSTSTSTSEEQEHEENSSSGGRDLSVGRPPEDETEEHEQLVSYEEWQAMEADRLREEEARARTSEARA
jgi:hypothetical protein